MGLEFNGVPAPAEGSAIDYKGEKFIVPDQAIIPYIEGDGTGRDIWKAARRVFDPPVEKVFRGRRRIVGYEGLAGEKAFKRFGKGLRRGRLAAIKEFRVAIKARLTRPEG